MTDTIKRLIPFTDAEIKMARNLAGQRVPAREIARRMGRSERAVRNKVRDLQPHIAIPFAQKREEIVAKFGSDIKALSDQYRLTQPTIVRIWREAGLLGERTKIPERLIGAPAVRDYRTVQSARFADVRLPHLKFLEVRS